MVGAHLAYEAGAAAEARALIERAIPELESDPELVAYLRSALLFIFSWLDDWASYVSTARLMQRSETPAARFFGYLAVASSTAPVDGTRAERLLTHAVEEQRLAQEAEPGLNTSLVGAWVHHVLASTSAYRAEYATTLRHTGECFAIDQANDYYTLICLWMRQMAAVCEIASGNPTAALVAMEALEGEGFGTDDGREARTLAELELGALETTRELDPQLRGARRDRTGHDPGVGRRLAARRVGVRRGRRRPGGRAPPPHGRGEPTRDDRATAATWRAGSASAASERSAWPPRSGTASTATRARPAR